MIDDPKPRNETETIDDKPQPQVGGGSRNDKPGRSPQGPPPGRPPVRPEPSVGGGSR